MFSPYHRASDVNKLFLFIVFYLVSSLNPLAAADTVSEPGSTPPPPVFTADDPRIEQSDPYLSLEWEIPDRDQPDPTVQFELQLALSEDFNESTTRYKGPDTASFIAGLAEGDYFFRVRSLSQEGDEASAWSDPLHVTIQYDSLAKAFLLFGIGAVVSIATVALVVCGDRRTRRESQ